MKKLHISKWLNYGIALVWIINGLICKVLDVVPRHQEIVGRILPGVDARLWTVLIGVAETALGLWILSDILTRLNAITQMVVIAAMNTMEFILAPDLLLWGKLNALFAGVFIVVIFYNEFVLGNQMVSEV